MNQKYKFTKDDLDACWSPHYLNYFIDILNGDYKLEVAREDLLSLINSKFDSRRENKIIDRFGNEINEGDYVEVQKIKCKIYKNIDGQLCFYPYQKVENVSDYFSKDIIKLNNE